MLLGLHVSIAGSIDCAVDRAVELGCSTFQIFTRNPRGWSFKDIDPEEASSFVEKCKEHGFRYPVAHMPYLPNLASPDDEIYGRSVSVLTSELDRCGTLRVPYLVTHLGSHRGRGEMSGLRRVIEACNHALSEVDNKVMILLENTAGTKNSVGSTFENLHYILKNVEPNRRIGVCFDTCHAFAAGYDLRRDEDVSRSLGLLDDTIDLDKVKVVHLNDSKGIFNSHSDRHDHIGLGYIGEAGFTAFLKHKLAKTRPMVLETPIDTRRDDEGNLKKTRELAGEKERR